MLTRMGWSCTVRDRAGGRGAVSTTSDATSEYYALSTAMLLPHQMLLNHKTATYLRVVTMTGNKLSLVAQPRLMTSDL